MSAIPLPPGNVAAETIRRLRVIDAEIYGTLIANYIEASGANITDINADNITTGDLAAARIVAGSLDGDKITANTLDADRITANSIAVERLVLGSSDNMVDDPSFESGTKDFHRFTNDAGTWSVGTGGVERSGDNAARWVANGGSGVNDSIFTNTQTMSCREGDTHYASVWLRPDGSFNRTVQLRLRYFDGGVLQQDNGSSPSVTASTWNHGEHTATAPAGADTVEARLRIVTAIASAGALDVDDWEMRRMIGTLVIDDQAVDIDRMLDPVDVQSKVASAQGQTIDGTVRTMASFTFTVPSWAGEVTIMAVASFYNIGPDGTSDITGFADIAGSSVGMKSHAHETNPFSITNGVTSSHVKTYSSPGSTYLVKSRAQDTNMSTSGCATVLSAIMITTR